ncbi:MAG: hypothetical protein KJZ47_07590, partial [Gemmatimonadales bacterium]|nr:hypothetical protein [Gemmatimonadales bacterium]
QRRQERPCPALPGWASAGCGACWAGGFSRGGGVWVGVAGPRVWLGSAGAGPRAPPATLQTTFRVAGPLDLRLLVAAGRIATGGSLLEGEDWRTGARVGVGVETPIGPIHFETGWGTGGRKASLVRIGRWF